MARDSQWLFLIYDVGGIHLCLYQQMRTEINSLIVYLIDGYGIHGGSGMKKIIVFLVWAGNLGPYPPQLFLSVRWCGFNEGLFLSPAAPLVSAFLVLSPLICVVPFNFLLSASLPSLCDFPWPHGPLPSYC